MTFRWRPFHLLIILQEMKHIPFADKPAKSAYMWRDVERRAAMYDIPVKLPTPYPAKRSVVANLVALVGMREGWGEDFVRAAYRRWFQNGQETGCEPNVSESLREIGQDPERVLALANSDDTNAALTAERTLHANSEFSAHRHSPLIANCFGATTGSMTRSAGAGSDASDVIEKLSLWHASLAQTINVIVSVDSAFKWADNFSDRLFGMVSSQ
jgi:hypothetical protein